ILCSFYKDVWMLNHFSCGKLYNFTNQLPMLFVSAMLGNNAINNVDIMGAIFSLYQFIADCLFKQCARDKQPTFVSRHTSCYNRFCLSYTWHTAYTN